MGSNYSHKRSETQLLIEQAALYRLSVALNHETELQAMMDVAVRVAAELFKVELTAIALVDDGGDTFSGKANIGWSPEIFSFAQHIPLDSDNGLSYAIRHHAVVAIPDEINETRWKAPAWVLQMGIRSALIAPMSVGGKTVGGLIVNDRRTRDWGDNDERLIALIANNTAEAIERVNLIIGTAQEITERKRAEEAHAALSRLLEESLNEIYVFDSETLHFIQVNYGARHNLGYTLDELRALTPLDLKPELNAQTFGELIQPLRTGEKQRSSL